MLQEKEALELIPLWALVAKVSGEVPVCTIVFLTGSLILLIDIFGNHVAITVLPSSVFAVKLLFIWTENESVLLVS